MCRYQFIFWPRDTIKWYDPLSTTTLFVFLKKQSGLLIWWPDYFTEKITVWHSSRIYSTPRCVWFPLENFIRPPLRHSVIIHYIILKGSQCPMDEYQISQKKLNHQNDIMQTYWNHFFLLPFSFSFSYSLLYVFNLSSR